MINPYEPADNWDTLSILKPVGNSINLQRTPLPPEATSRLDIWTILDFSGCGSGESGLGRGARSQWGRLLPAEGLLAPGAQSLLHQKHSKRETTLKNQQPSATMSYYTTCTSAMATPTATITTIHDPEMYWKPTDSFCFPSFAEGLYSYWLAGDWEVQHPAVQCPHLRQDSAKRNPRRLTCINWHRSKNIRVKSDSWFQWRVSGDSSLVSPIVHWQSYKCQSALVCRLCGHQQGAGSCAQLAFRQQGSSISAIARRKVAHCFTELLRHPVKYLLL